MTILDRHVLGAWLKTFGLIMAALLGLLILVDMQRNLADFIGSGAGMWDVFYYYLVLVPGNVPLVLQISVLLSLLYALGQLHRGNEITAMRAAGLGLFRITRAVWLFGLLLAGFVWYLNASLIPWSVEEARGAREQMRRAAETRTHGAGAAGAFTALAFANDPAGRLWFLNSYDDLARRGHGVSLSFFDRDRHEIRRLIAKEAYFDRWRGAWVFLEGREFRFDPATGEHREIVPFAHRLEERSRVGGERELLDVQHVGQPLVVDARRVDGFLHVHAVVDDVHDRLERDRDDARAARAACHHEDVAVLGYDRR